MTSLHIWPDRSLRVPGRTVTENEWGTPAFLDRCEEIKAMMLRCRGLGLAACQIGWDARVFVLVANEEMTAGEVFVNPEILARGPDVLGEEACLSFPGVKEQLPAPRWVVLRYVALGGETETRRLEGQLAVAAFHESEHTLGRTMLDRMGPLRKRLFLQRYRKVVVAIKRECEEA